MGKNIYNIRIKDDTDNDNDDGYHLKKKEEEDNNLLDKANFSKSTFPDHLQRLEVVGTELGALQSVGKIWSTRLSHIFQHPKNREM